ncbi:MAG: BrnT family toxin [Candidatus Sumerlaeota bacterium]|nr:BrnT family toxin [Candidatus Sumerlaeota bacterium]
MSRQFEWDESKNRANMRKHGIDFADAVKMFDHPMLIGLDEREDYGEDRWVGIGVLNDMISVVVFSETADATRIISVRKALKHECEEYQEKNRH